MFFDLVVWLWRFLVKYLQDDQKMLQPDTVLSLSDVDGVELYLVITLQIASDVLFGDEG